MSTRLILSLGLLVSVAAQAAPPVEKPWVTASNANTRLLLEAQARFGPEDASSSGLSEYDGLATDLGPKLSERYIAAMTATRDELQQRLAGEKDANVRQDLQILIGSINDEIVGTRLGDKYNLDWNDVPQMEFGGLQGLLDKQLPASRRAKSLELLQRYTGLFPGSTPMVDLAKARFNESRAKSGLIGPFKARVEQSIANVPTYLKGIHDLFAEFKIEGAGPALAALDKQLSDYAAWEKAQVLPLARSDFRLPPELYAYRLKRVGIDIDPRVLIERAQLEFMETRANMQALAPLVAAQKNIKASDYREVIRALKRDTIANDKLEAHYHDVNQALETAIKRERVADLPARPMIMRLASAAESAAQPAPHMQPPPLIGNTGEQGQFVLPVGNPGATGKDDAYDDFNNPSAGWTLSAHEGRPGHELQFSAMIERGVSQARSLYAFNSVNVEGWALYAEAEMLPSEPLDGQMIALQFRLLRAARAMLDPMLNLGLISREDAGKVLTEDVMLSPAMARQELDRYTFRSPGQAGSYYYGYARIMQLRAETELALGDKFDRLTFNNFLLDQGLLPPDLLAKAVREEFVPAQRAKK
ncbi:MAG TPA: DUF885 domain-containing protein [Arenimonas sp.]|nr:DUF885 domain-containing protein [Arenimonas sp.]HMB56262.1 DUF885 domain-containing protein [Arenimonas sp.]